MKRIPLLITAIALSALVGGGTAYLVTRNAQPAAGERYVEFADQKAGSHFTAYERENYPDLTYAAENAVKAVVNVENIQEVRSSRYGRSQGYDPFLEFFGIPQGYGEQQQSQPRERRSGGSGVIISTDGYIVTNNHVVENAGKLKVTLNDGRTFTAKLIGMDPTTDVALVKIEATDLPTLAFGDSDELRLGEWVLAIGSPFDLRSTVTAGIVSAKARNLGVIPSDFSIEAFIQTDAAVNPGNSGGALVNARGELIGINTVIKSPTGSYAGYSFAIPEAIVKKVVVDLKESGVVQRALLGIRFTEVNDDFLDKKEAEEYKITERGGVFVAEVVADGAAKAAGIKVGDVITAIDGVTLNSGATLQELVARHRPNEKVTLTVKRGGEVKQIDVVLRNKAGKAELLKSDYVDVAAALGGNFSDLNDKGRKELKVDGGVVVVGVTPGGILAKEGIRKGSVIMRINEKAVNSVSDLSKITEKVSSIDVIYPDGTRMRIRFANNE